MSSHSMRVAADDVRMPIDDDLCEVTTSAPNDPVSDCSKTDVFTIPPKYAPIEHLKKWRKATLALNAARRFRYTLDSKRAEERETLRRRAAVQKSNDICYYLIEVANSTRMHTCANFEARVYDLSFPYGWK
ncbi:uncharacterized protein LOC131217659 [Magnolia sinica]|uniref:uncharacterized protein LOC131217659 n=1 Tax=Magnolia sinica TaxID=86752 RepID=UPI00265A0310|nr:uncharacterized protein LOC131217659 [Magnolia sinica]